MSNVSFDNGVFSRYEPNQYYGGIYTGKGSAGQDDVVGYGENNWTSLSSTYCPAGTSWHIYESLDYQQMHISNIDGINKFSGNVNFHLNSTKIALAAWAGEPAQFDYILVAKYVYPEPAQGAWGQEESCRTLSISSSSGGTTNPSAGTYFYNDSEYQAVNATPLSGYQFDHWNLNGTYYNSSSSINLLMNESYVLTPYFQKTGGGCPYVYVWNGSAYVMDNNILPASENGNGTYSKDYYLLQQLPVPLFKTGGKSVYSLQIGEFENNVDYIDQVRLEAVDHSEGTSLAVTQRGQIIVYKDLVSPLTCIDSSGNDELAKINAMNGNVSDSSTYYQGNKSDWLLLDFGRVAGPYANLVLRDDQKCAECIDVQVPNATCGWQTVDVLNPRDFWSIEAVNMSAYLPANRDFIVRLLWTQSHRLDYVGLDTSAPAPAKLISAPPTLAIHSTMGDVTQKLLYDDEQCVKLVNDQQITAWFTLPIQAQGTTRSFVLFTDGYYYTIS